MPSMIAVIGMQWARRNSTVPASARIHQGDTIGVPHQGDGASLRLTLYIRYIAHAPLSTVNGL